MSSHVASSKCCFAPSEAGTPISMSLIVTVGGFVVASSSIAFGFDGGGWSLGAWSGAADAWSGAASSALAMAET